MEQRKILFGLHQMDGIGWKSINRIVLFYADLNELFTTSLETLSDCLESKNKAMMIKQNLSIVNWIDLHWSRYEKLGIQVITFLDELYPERLKQFNGAPWVMYYLGDLEYISRNTIAVVGTRNPTSYGKKVAEQMALELSKNGFCVVSGLARGIDSIAHLAALEGSGGTIAVLGTAINEIYPREHYQLAQKIIQKGLILSEFPLGTVSKASLFPMRNRIIAGLALGTLVVEAAEKSGSLITGMMALDNNRDLFAIPGPITSPKSKGTLELLKKGAHLVTSTEDIFEEYYYLIPTSRSLMKIPDTEGENITENEQQILDLLCFTPMKIDEILEKSKFAFGHLHSVLLSLTIKNRIEQLSGSSYVKL